MSKAMSFLMIYILSLEIHMQRHNVQLLKVARHLVHFIGDSEIKRSDESLKEPLQQKFCTNNFLSPCVWDHKQTFSLIWHKCFHVSWGQSNSCPNTSQVNKIFQMGNIQLISYSFLVILQFPKYHKKCQMHKMNWRRKTGYYERPKSTCRGTKFINYVSHN